MVKFARFNLELRCNISRRMANVKPIVDIDGI